jgi:hypothetical protein
VAAKRFKLSGNEPSETNSLLCDESQTKPVAMLQQGNKTMIRKLKSGKYRLYSKKKDPKTGKRRNLGTFNSRAAAEKHERAVQYFKRH